jgi:EmrB/QacA subfamily drug resistance transporter
MPPRLEQSVIVPLLVGGALLMENIDATVLSTALPALARDFGADAITLKISLTAYVVSLGVFIPVSGWLADRYGSRRLFRAAIAVFSLGSILCAASTTLSMFIMARFIQGIGGALMVPVGRIVIFRTVPKSEFVRAVSILTIPSLLGPVIGPPLGGFITEFFHWRGIFLINLPIAALGLYLVAQYMPDLKEQSVLPLDWAGFLLSAGGGALFMLGTSLVDSPLLSNGAAWSLAAAGLLLLLAYVAYARRARAPLLELRFLRIATYRASVMGGSLFRVALGSIPFLLPLALQEGLGLSPFQSGLLTACSAFGSLAMKSTARHVLGRFGFRRVLVWNALCTALVITAYGLFEPGTPQLLIAAVILVGSVFPSLQFTSINAITYADIEQADVARATSLASTVQQVSLGMGITIAGIVLHQVGESRAHAGIDHRDFLIAFIVMAGFSVASMLLFARLSPDAARDVSRHRADEPA